MALVEHRLRICKLRLILHYFYESQNGYSLYDMLFVKKDFSNFCI